MALKLAQLMATNTPAELGLALWMAWAYSSFPVPLSDWSRTVTSVWARRLTSYRQAADRGETATMESKV